MLQLEVLSREEQPSKQEYLERQSTPITCHSKTDKAAQVLELPYE